MSGEGSIFRRASDGKWVAQLSSGPRGQRKYVQRIGRTRNEAAARLTELKADRRTNREPMTVGAFLEQWVNEARDIRATTRRGYSAVVTTHLVPTIGHIPMVDLTAADVEAMLHELAPRMAPKTLRNAHAVLRRALQQAVRTGRLDRNVASAEFIDTPKVPTLETRVLTEAEIERLLAVLPGDRIQNIVVTALGTGLRMGELLGLAWGDIKSDHLTVEQALVYQGNHRYRREAPKTERSKRRVPLSPAVREALDRQRARLIAEGFVPITTGPVFTNHRGQNLSGSWVTKHFYVLLEAAKINRLPFKNLRTTFATRLLEAGVADITIAALMGHARTATTKRHYMAVSQELAEQAIATLGRQSPRQSPIERDARADA